MKRSRFVIALAVLLGSLLAPGGVALAQGNLLVNGSFEQPTYIEYGWGFDTLGGNSLPGWTITQNTVDLATQNCPDGNQWIDLAGSPGPGSIQQTVPTAAGHVYRFSGYVSVVGLGYLQTSRANVYVNGLLLAQIVYTVPPGGIPTWQPFSYSFTATGPTTLTLTDASGYDTLGSLNNGTHLDGLALVDVTPPGAPGLSDLPATAAARRLKVTFLTTGHIYEIYVQNTCTNMYYSSHHFSQLTQPWEYAHALRAACQALGLDFNRETASSISITNGQDHFLQFGGALIGTDMTIDYLPKFDLGKLCHFWGVPPTPAPGSDTH